MAKAPKVGYTVIWNTSQAETTGEVVAKKTKDFQFER